MTTELADNYMSTRCQIGFMSEEDTNPKKPQILIYRHSDGYPDGIKPAMGEFFPKFLRERGAGDTEYMGAQFLAYMISEHQNWAKSLDTPRSIDTWMFLGYGICGDKKFHGDIEYYYSIRPLKDKEIPVIELNNTYRRIPKVEVKVYEVNHKYPDKYPIMADGTKKPVQPKTSFKLIDTWIFEAEKEEHD